MKNIKNYNIGLDIGVASVGWAVTDENNNIIKKKGKNLWGARIFEEASTARDRRTKRGVRRRLDRRNERINILQSLIKDDLDEKDINFLPRLRETNLKNGKEYNLFSDFDFTDKTLEKKYKTIYHLRNYLINENEKVDIRLVYLAIHHIIKYRGNFLYDTDFSSNTSEVEEKIDVVVKWLKENDIELIRNNTEILNILKTKQYSKSRKKELLLECFRFDSDEKLKITNIINSLLGYSFDINKIFSGIEIEKNKLTFSSEIENEEEILGILESKSEIYEALKTIYSWYILQDILNGKENISEAFIEKYNKYAKDLELLKTTYKTYFKNEYNEMFKKMGKDNYVAYNGKSQGKSYSKCKPENFFKALKKKIEQLPDNYAQKEIILEDINDGTFLRKINVTDNGAIPHQLHQKELIKILENQSKYYKTLEENKQNIIDLFTFRIPYYVGPLSKNDNSKWGWVVRTNNNEKIYPWNFENIVDTDATAEEFIRRMTNKCTYLLNEDVMPKHSLLYSKYCVLNELNNIRVDNHHIKKDIKKKVIEVLFKNKKKITMQMFKNFLKTEGQPAEIITGLSNGESFNSNMDSYIDIKNIFGEFNEADIEMYEEIIYWITIFEDKKILKRKIQTKYPKINDEQLKKLIKLRYTGWSRLSKKLLIGLKSYNNDTIIDLLEKTNKNLMQIINDEKYGFDKKIEEFMPHVSNSITYNDVDEIQTSPANKRAIWQTVKIVKEIEKVMKSKPNKIYIEFARDEQEKGKQKDNRAKKLLKLYEDINSQVHTLKVEDKNVYKELKQYQNDKSISERLYLYFIQQGKCMYSGKRLDIDNLSQYEVDHIIPQSYQKDDSIDNKALVLRSKNQRKKDSLLLSDEIIDTRIDWWKYLLDNGLISQTKFYRLVKRKMFETDADKSKFINRQLVETRQIVKYVTNLLKNCYIDTEIFSLRAELTHGFRTKYDIYKNRNVNNYHHAHDAYIISVIGNILSAKWPHSEEFKYGEYMENYMRNLFNGEIDHKEKHGIIMNTINKYIDINKVKHILNFKDCFMSRMLVEETGEFYNQTLYSPNDPKNHPVIPLKNNLDAQIYGGYSGEKKAYCVIYSYISKKGKQEYGFIGIPIKAAYDIKNKKQTLENYIKESVLKDKVFSNFKIVKRKILKYQEYLDENNECMRFCSDSEIRVSKELIVDNKILEMIYLMNADEKNLTDENVEKKNNINYEYLYDYLVEKLEKEYKVFINICDKLKVKAEEFIELNLDEQKSVINGLIDLMEKSQGNLSELGLGDRAGRMSKKTFNTDKLLKMTFIDKSVTGIYERRYKINGVENSCC